MKLSMIAAIAEDGAIGRNSSLPWHIPEDLERFRKLTTGHVVIMGRKTWDSLPQRFRPLPNRHNIVLTSRAHELHLTSHRHVTFTDSEGLADVLEELGHMECFVIGGASVFTLLMHNVQTAHVTHVKAKYDGCDAWYQFPTDQFEESARESYKTHDFVTYVKKIPVHTAESP